MLVEKGYERTKVAAYLGPGAPSYSFWLLFQSYRNILSFSKFIFFSTACSYCLCSGLHIFLLSWRALERFILWASLHLKMLLGNDVLDFSSHSRHWRSPDRSPVCTADSHFSVNLITHTEGSFQSLLVWLFMLPDLWNTQTVHWCPFCISWHLLVEIFLDLASPFLFSFFVKIQFRSCPECTNDRES